ncbi:DoxX family membrane protein, partial [candidate division KSB1 bacterium]|nr:DoxX family membrane protein [candidate division KSB1 bacterium]
MERRSNLKYFIYLLRWVIAALFIYAGVSKILDPATFAEDIDNYRILPYLLVSIVAVVLPWLEVLCGISLISG